MKRRAVVCVLISTLVAGCGGYRSVPLPLESEHGAEDFPIRERSSARVVLVSGEDVEGEVVSVDAEGFTIGEPGNYGWRETAVAYGDLVRLEVQSRETSWYASLGGGALLFVAAILIYGIATTDWPPS